MTAKEVNQRIGKIMGIKTAEVTGVTVSEHNITKDVVVEITARPNKRQIKHIKLLLAEYLTQD